MFFFNFDSNCYLLWNNYYIIRKLCVYNGSDYFCLFYVKELFVCWGIFYIFNLVYFEFGLVYLGINLVWFGFYEFCNGRMLIIYFNVK